MGHRAAGIAGFVGRKPELDLLRERLLTLLGSAHPTLTDIARYYFLHPSKQMRPLLVLLFARATNGLGRDWPLVDWAADCEGARGRTEELDHPLNRADVLNDYNPNMPDHTASFSSVFSLVPPSAPSHPPLPPPPRPSTSAPLIPALAPSARLLPTQLRLAQIVEMIHVASLLHDDVIDSADLRRGVPSGPAAFGNKLAILGGDFLLGRASAALSRLGDHEVVELIASVIANLVEGEILQLGKAGPDAGRTGESEALVAARVGQERWNVYLKKTYLKTASLMAKGARAAVVLGGSKEGEIWKEVAYAYGRNLGIAFQVRSPRAPPHPCRARSPARVGTARGRRARLRRGRGDHGQARRRRPAPRARDRARALRMGGAPRDGPAHRAQVRAAGRR